jgi:hypothetical protein
MKMVSFKGVLWNLTKTERDHGKFRRITCKFAIL